MPVLKGSLIGGRRPETEPAENRAPTLPDLARKWGANAAMSGSGSENNPIVRSGPEGGQTARQSRFQPKVGDAAIEWVARDSGIPSSGRGRNRVMPPEARGVAGRIADNGDGDGGRYEGSDVR